MAINIDGNAGIKELNTYIVRRRASLMGQHVAMGTYVDSRKGRVAATCDPGRNTGGGHEWIVHPQAVPGPLLSSICS